MTVGTFVLLALAGGIGAVGRFLADTAVTRGVPRRFPWGILVVNVVGSFLLGFVTGLAQSSVLSLPWLAVVGAGLLGGFTTFSTAMVDTVRLVAEREWGAALANAGGMLALTIAVAVAGIALGGAL